MNVLVTGANGFLGRQVVTELLRRGHGVRALVRPASPAKALPWRDRVEFFRADLRGGADLAPAFAGMDALVHLAAAVTGDEQTQLAASVLGTERLLAAMANTPVKRLVLASSFSVYDWRRARGVLAEESPVESSRLYERDGYAVSKCWEERITQRAVDAHGWKLTILRPGFLWGRGHADIAGIGQRVGRAYLVVGLRRPLPLSHVENCAHCFVCAVEDDRAIGQTFNVVDDEPIHAWRYAGEYFRRSGDRGFRLPLPYCAGHAVGRMAQRISKWVFRGAGKLPSILVPCRFEARFKPLHFDNAKLKRIIGWRSPYDFGQCLERTYGTAAPASQRPGAVST